ncbi:hypothetical protein [Acinetobacter vivianii]|uniref:hypothetical protein n=1 Tax=Acinetobacter vivianii TaxID=1776742 RepID=UPI002DC026ED|nr:hypothetical protein [Acinetobacter vivianii]MEB6478632.1 hypothetical protein [Acinetobacter vivianii]MEB6657537.1 hypothetical protein [Acinetobacter vivianii]
MTAPHDRNVYPDSMADFPTEQKVCVITEPLCNQYIKERNYYLARPYNFLLDIEQWSEVAQNGIELLMAVRFGMEYDVNTFPDGFMHDIAFHTQMYLKFHNYVLKHSLKEIPKIVGEFQQTAFKVRFLSTFAVNDLRELRNLGPFAQGKGAVKSLNDLNKTLSKLNVLNATRDLELLAKNGGPLHINRDMFKRVFKKDFNPRMVQIFKDQRIYKGDPNNVQANEFKEKFGY